MKRGVGDGACDECAGTALRGALGQAGGSCSDLAPVSLLAEVKAIPGARLILSPSAGPYEPSLSPQVAANYLAFLDAGWDLGR